MRVQQRDVGTAHTIEREQLICRELPDDHGDLRAVAIERRHERMQGALTLAAQQGDRLVRRADAF